MDSLLSSLGNCNVNSPIDISDMHSNGRCVKKCDLSFKYNNSSVPISNKGDYLSIKYDDTSNVEAPVNYNSNKYKVSDVRIYSPSLHTYNGSQMPGEILIIHTPIMGGQQLFVSVPIMDSNSVTPGSSMISAILKHALANVPAENNESRLDNIKNFTLNSIVPKKTYYYYEGVNFLEQPCSAKIDIICYLPHAANIGISQDLSKNLSSIIKPSNIIPKQYSEGETPKLYYNEEGSTSLNADGDDIVMSCEPFNDSSDPNEITEYVVDTNPAALNPSDIFNSGWFQVIAGSLTFFLIICVLNFLFGIFQKKSELSDVASVNKGSMLSFLNKKT